MQSGVLVPPTNDGDDAFGLDVAISVRSGACKLLISAVSSQHRKRLMLDAIAMSRDSSSRASSPGIYGEPLGNSTFQKGGSYLLLMLAVFIVGRASNHDWKYCFTTCKESKIAAFAQYHSVHSYHWSKSARPTNKMFDVL